MNNNIYKTIVLDDEHYVDVVYDLDADNPRDWGDTKFCIREHNQYDLPNDLDFDFDVDSVHDLKNDYHIFQLRCYEHGWIKFSITSDKTLSDGGSKVGFIAVPDKVPKEEALQKAEQELFDYNKYLNGEVYWFILYKKFPPIEKDGRIYTTEPEDLDYCFWFYDFEAIAQNLPEQFREKFLKEI